MERNSDNAVSASSSRKSDDQSAQESVKKGLSVSKKSITGANDRKVAVVEGITSDIINISNKKKSFSLMGLMSQPKQTSSVDVGLGKENIKVVPINQQIGQAATPRWVTNYKSVSTKTFESHIDRKLAMDFFNAAVACLPQDKIDPVSVASALEDALFTKYEGIADEYWNRVHEICGALAGKKKMGHLAQKILDGEYATPLDVINTPKKLLTQSFEGHWIP